MSKKRLLLTCGVVILAAVTWLSLKIVSSQLNTPAEGTISTSAATTPTVQAGINLTPKAVSGVYASFNYPSGLTKDATTNPVTPIVATYDFSYRDIDSWNLAIDILTVPSGQLSDNNAYQFRKINPSIYQESQLVLNKQSIDVMSDKTVGGFSEVAFLVNGQYQATVSLSGDDANGLSSLQSTFKMILSTWHWRVS